jgi:hypothetical protein
MTLLTQCPTARKTNRRLASRRNAPVTCANCGRSVERYSRQQRFCSRRCRQAAHYVEKVARGDFSTRTVARPTKPRKNDNKSKRLQWAIRQSGHRILAPTAVLAVEVFDRDWQVAISSDGVAIEIGRLRARALVERRP